MTNNIIIITVADVYPFGFPLFFFTRVLPLLGRFPLTAWYTQKRDIQGDSPSTIIPVNRFKTNIYFKFLQEFFVLLVKWMRTFDFQIKTSFLQ